MNHAHADELLLFASGELDELRVTEIAAHVAACGTCSAALAKIDESLVVLDAAWQRGARPYPRAAVWAGVALAAAAVAVVLIRLPQPQNAGVRWTPTTPWSATAGYVAGGKALVDLDAQLTRLEQESYYGRP